LSFPLFFFFNDPPPTDISTLSLHDALPISSRSPSSWRPGSRAASRSPSPMPSSARSAERRPAAPAASLAGQPRKGLVDGLPPGSGPPSHGADLGTREHPDRELTGRALRRPVQDPHPGG